MIHSVEQENWDIDYLSQSVQQENWDMDYLHRDHQFLLHAPSYLFFLLTILFFCYFIIPSEICKKWLPKYNDSTRIMYFISQGSELTINSDKNCDREEEQNMQFFQDNYKTPSDSVYIKRWDTQFSCSVHVNLIDEDKNHRKRHRYGFSGECENFLLKCIRWNVWVKSLTKKKKRRNFIIKYKKKDTS